MRPEEFIHKHVVAELLKDGYSEAAAQGGGKRGRRPLPPSLKGFIPSGDLCRLPAPRQNIRQIRQAEQNPLCQRPTFLRVASC